MSRPPLWSDLAAIAATGGQATAPFAATGVSIDSRSLAPGDLFVALKAARDGHDFVAAAFEAGAAAALVTHRPEGVPEDAPLLIVDNVQTALEALARAARARTRARVVAVTGSAGKTSTKEMLRQMLSDQGETHAAEKSYNNHWGVPLTLAQMPESTEFAVIEIGMNHPGEIAPLARMARPDVALITTVAPAHLAAFDNLDGIAYEKASIMEGLSPAGLAVLNADCPGAAILRAEAARLGLQSVGFGRAAHDYVLKSVAVHEDVTAAEAEMHGVPLVFKVGAAGAHYAENGLGALAVTEGLGADLARAATSLGQWHAGSGRGARARISLDAAHPSQTLSLLDDSYNANPASMAAALAVLDQTEPAETGRRIAVLGDMRELGPTSPKLHAGLADLPAMARIDHFYLIGPEMEALARALPATKVTCAPDSDALAATLPRALRPGDVVLVKGSLSMGLARVVAAIQRLHQPPASRSDNP